MPNSESPNPNIGTFDGFFGLLAVGWAWNPHKPNDRMTVRLEIDGTTIAQVPADVFRQDLVDGGIGDGIYGFEITLPESLRDSLPHEVSVRLADTGAMLAYSPRTIRLTSTSSTPISENVNERWPGKSADLQHRIAQLHASDLRCPLYELHLAHLAISSANAISALDKFSADNVDSIIRDSSLMNDFTEAAFCLQSFNSLRWLIRQKYGVEVVIEYQPDNVSCDASVVRWIIHPDRSAKFIFSKDIENHTYAGVLLKHWVQELPVLAAYQKQQDGRSGGVWLNTGDMGTVPGLTYCDYRPGYILLPDPIFLGSDGYQSTKDVYTRKAIPWQSRRSLAFWRGVTTGWHDSQGAIVSSWKDLPRVRLCQLARSDPQRRIDATLTGLVQIPSRDLDEVRQTGLVGPFVHWENFQKYKYLVDIDGNTNAWPGLFTKLCSGSAVLKVRSPANFRQWYYDRLIPWTNYVPVEADMSDLLEKVSWLVEHDDKAHKIGKSGQELAFSMTVSTEIVMAMQTLTNDVSWT